MSDKWDFLYLGLRPSPLEWRAELDAATRLGHGVQVLSDADLGHVSLPGVRTGAFRWRAEAAECAKEIVAGLRRPPAVVTCWGDRYVRLTAHVADALGLRGPGLAAATTCGDKVAQRRALEPCGLNPWWRPGSTIADLRAAVTGPPQAAGLVFKLAHTSGGLGIRFVTPGCDLEEIVRSASLNYVPSPAFVVEEFAEGSEHSVAGVAGEGSIVVLGVTDKTVGEDLRTHTTVFPSALPGPRLEEVVRAAEAAVRAVGLCSGGFHVDLRLTTTGPVVLEVGARLGGDLINSHLVPLATGGRTRPYEAVLEVLATGRLPAPPRVTGAAGMLVLPAHETRTITGIPQVSAVTDWSAPESAQVAVVVVADDTAALEAAMEEVRQHASTSTRRC
ncbi:ATP-grasp domain-containing protein [Nonomuraea rhizosphaerae]|uniref:ATP-grasp domain-containing protein n=1 Tax=Nonomuraea rhizosphaerae TaxID=2665663 RepID=UPI001C5DC0CC|nr:ATP-grasp domain-containing protein [Nonomuraea rhizosphaerae]